MLNQFMRWKMMSALHWEDYQMIMVNLRWYRSRNLNVELNK